VGLDLELEDDPGRGGREQVLEEQRGLPRQGAAAAAQARPTQLTGGALVRESLEVGAQRQVRVVQQHQPPSAVR
jgi:hypothetical protein